MPETEPEPRQDQAAHLLAENPLLATLPHCGECGSPVRWMTPAELRDIDREVYRGVTAGLPPEVVAGSDVWWCPGCGGVGIRTDENDTEADTQGAVDGDNRCTDCGTEVEWHDPAHVATIDKDAYLHARRTYGAAALLDGEAAVCPGCGRITFVPDQDVPGVPGRHQTSGTQE